MQDLRNERAEVVDRLRSSNYEPVNAEGFSPTWERSWERIRREIATSHLFVLILGDSYGWIPTAGPFAGAAKSVTELEYDEAVRQRIPVLAFIKRLDYDADRESEDARRRDGFRKRVCDWSSGTFRREFDLARDLADAVAEAFAEVLAEKFRESVQARHVEAEVEVQHEPVAPLRRVDIPPDLVEAVTAGEVVAFFGAGVSLAAGMPSAVAFTDKIVQRIREIEPEYVPPASGSRLNAVAADLESLAGRAELEATVARMMQPPLVLRPTEAHRIGVRLFPQLITTNFDTLLEEAAGQRVPVIAAEASAALPDAVIVKLHGAIEQPTSLVLTDHDLVDLPKGRPQLWDQLIRLLQTRRLLVVGSSLRDPTLVELLDAVGPSLHGWAVMYASSRADRLRLTRWSLTPIEAKADDFLIDLEDATKRRQHRI